MKISASFLSIKEPVKENIEQLVNTDIDYLHLDIMDGIFVSNKTWNYEEIKNLISYQKPFDIHLMVEDVPKYLYDYLSLNPEFMTFHYEIDYDVMSLIKELKEKDIKVGLSIKPETRVECLLPYLPFLDLVLVMSVEPGKGGQSFLDSSIDKIDYLYKKREQNEYDYVIEVDGGINDQTIQKVNKADICVVGSYITNGNYEKQVSHLKEEI